MFGPDIDNAAREHAVAEFPRESCGIVVDGAYIPVANVSQKPEEFEVPADTWVKYGTVQGVLHSHKPQFDKSGNPLPLAPSANDMQHQISTHVPWGITLTDGKAATRVLWWGDFRLDEPLLGRSFVPGVTDCYGAIRSWRWQTMGTKLIDIPRDVEWWEAGGDLYNESFERVGFRAIAESEAKPGDLALINFRSKVPNHGGTLLDGGLFYHHLQNRVSCREPIGRWRAMISKWLRYEG